MPCWASPVNGKVRENLKWFVTFIIGGGILEGYQLFFSSPLFFWQPHGAQLMVSPHTRVVPILTLKWIPDRCSQNSYNRKDSNKFGWNECISNYLNSKIESMMS